MKKVKKIIYLLPCILLILSACSKNPTSEETNQFTEKTDLDTLAMETEMTITSSNNQVSDFVAKNIDYETEYETDECYNITPVFIDNNSDYKVFKYINSAESFIMYDGEIYSIGTCFGGFGITSMALADLNKDGEYELYYTFSWGSGIHRSQAGYFDPISKEIHIFEYSLFHSDMMLTVNNDGDLCVNSAYLNINDFVNFSIKAQDFMGTIRIEEDKIALNITQQNHYNPSSLTSLHTFAISSKMVFSFSQSKSI